MFIRKHQPKPLEKEDIETSYTVLKVFSAFAVLLLIVASLL